jgi:hypothetical protein
VRHGAQRITVRARVHSVGWACFEYLERCEHRPGAREGEGFGEELRGSGAMVALTRACATPYPFVSAPEVLRKGCVSDEGEVGRVKLQGEGEGNCSFTSILYLAPQAAAR